MAVEWHIPSTGSEQAKDEAVCSVCGCTVDVDDVEDTSGWRWYSDGRGGLLPLCKSCPLPKNADLFADGASPPPTSD